MKQIIQIEVWSKGNLIDCGYMAVSKKEKYINEMLKYAEIPIEPIPENNNFNIGFLSFYIRYINLYV